MSATTGTSPSEGRPGGAQPNRRRLLTAAVGSTVGAAAVGAAWFTTGEPTIAGKVTRLVPSNGFTQATSWTTLGTMGGPIASRDRAQPANLLVQDGSDAVLVETGDGVVDQLVKAGVDLASVGTVILSHLHIDHTAGLNGVLGRRLQQRIPGALRIYGPPGTQQLVDQIAASQRYLDDLMNADAAATGSLAPTTVTVTEVTEGSAFTVGNTAVRVTTNSHYGFGEGTAEAIRFQSLSYRFNQTGRSIVFTGDTGPSTNVEHLASGADLLISEIIDPDQALADLRASRPDIPAIAGQALRRHFADQHLTAEGVGLLAQRAGVGAVVLTHNPMNANAIQRAGNTIAEHFNGPVAFADDLDTY